jgi:hypothetical protein
MKVSRKGKRGMLAREKKKTLARFEKIWAIGGKCTGCKCRSLIEKYHSPMGKVREGGIHGCQYKIIGKSTPFISYIYLIIIKIAGDSQHLFYL